MGEKKSGDVTDDGLLGIFGVVKSEENRRDISGTFGSVEAQVTVRGHDAT